MSANVVREEFEGLLAQQVGGYNRRKHIMNLSDFPEDLLLLILQRLQLQERLVCGLLCSKLRTAANTATTSMTLHTTSRSKFESLQAWLQAHGSDDAIISLDLRAPFSLNLPTFLPCARLCRLQLTDVQVHLAAAPAGPQLCCSALTCMSLHNCTVLDSAQQLDGLSVLQDLQDISITCDSSRLGTVCLMPGGLLSQLLRLTRLHFGDTMRFDSLQHLSCLTDLQQLRVSLRQGSAQETFTGVHKLQKLTYLTLSCSNTDQRISRAGTPDLCSLTSLGGLGVHGCTALDPAVLWHLTQLHFLVLKDCSLVGAAAGTASLLGELRFLTRLSYLSVETTLQHLAPQESVYTALTALKRLHVLGLSSCKLPANLWEQLAAAGGRWSCIHTLDLGGTNPLMDSAGLLAVAKCCPSLVTLSCSSAIKADAELSALQHLVSLTRLIIDRIRDEDAFLLATLESLKNLQICTPSSISDLGVMQLTALRHLTRLVVTGDLSEAILDEEHDTVTIVNQAPPPQVPDVAKQLLMCCMSSPDCQPVLWEELQGMCLNLRNTRSQLETVRSELASSKLRSKEVAIREKQAAAATSQAEAKQRRLDTRATNLKENNAVVQRRHLKLSEKARELTASRSELQSRPAAVTTQERQVSAANKQLARRTQQVAARERQLQAQTDVAGAKQQRLAGWTAELNMRERELNRREQQLMQMQASHPTHAPYRTPSMPPAPAGYRFRR